MNNLIIGALLISTVATSATSFSLLPEVTTIDVEDVQDSGEIALEESEAGDTEGSGFAETETTEEATEEDTEEVAPDSVVLPTNTPAPVSSNSGSSNVDNNLPKTGLDDVWTKINNSVSRVFYTIFSFLLGR